MYELFVLSACKDTTNNPNMQVFTQKNAKISLFLYIRLQVCPYYSYYFFAISIFNTACFFERTVQKFSLSCSCIFLMIISHLRGYYLLIPCLFPTYTDSIFSKRTKKDFAYVGKKQ